MANKNIIFRGIAYWSRPYEGMEDEYEDKKFYKTTVALDDESWAKFAKSGLKLKKRPVSQDEGAPDGITFKRDMEGKEVKDKQTGKTKILGGGPIRVVNADNEEIDDLIGNGSEVEVLVNVYSGEYKGRKYYGHRTEAIRVLKLVKYDPFVEDEDDNDSNSDFSHSASGSFDDLDEEPKKEEVKSKPRTRNKDLPF